jgi:hypothetical protein
MMELNDIKRAISNMPPHERSQVARYIEQLEHQPPRRPFDVDALEAAFHKMREGLSDEEIDAITRAMNEEYIEPVQAQDWDL